ncbi:hypothetical protein AWB80_01502 [Caballeronia pedi]|uniref:Uncharacterized protein n=1 Tax=Caballeronia pedi TaxID=1777141 RepID=A0A158A0P3_9BURK|nr:hypothetical protein AWB80_01502 [Caballeronia pedi]
MYCIVDLCRYAAAVQVGSTVFVGVIPKGINIQHQAEAFLELNTQGSAEFADVLACKELRLSGGGWDKRDILLEFISSSRSTIATIRCSGQSGEVVNAIAQGKWHLIQNSALHNNL